MLVRRILISRIWVFMSKLTWSLLNVNSGWYVTFFFFVILDLVVFLIFTKNSRNFLYFLTTVCGRRVSVWYMIFDTHTSTVLYATILILIVCLPFFAIKCANLFLQIEVGFLLKLNEFNADTGSPTIIFLESQLIHHFIRLYFTFCWNSDNI